MDIFNEQTSVLIRRFNELIKQSKTVDDFQSYISACTLDIIAGLFILLAKETSLFA